MICYIDRWMEFRVNKGENRGVDEHKNNPKYGVYFYKNKPHLEHQCTGNSFYGLTL